MSTSRGRYSFDANIVSGRGYRGTRDHFFNEGLDLCRPMRYLVCAEEVDGSEGNAKVDEAEEEVYADGIPAVPLDEEF